MDNKAQGALEYLLLIAGAVLVAAIVIVLLSSLAGTGKHQVEHSTAHMQHAFTHFGS